MEITIKDTWLIQLVFGVEIVLENGYIGLGFFWSSLLFYIILKEWFRWKKIIPDPWE